MQDRDHAGISFMRGVEYLESPSPGYLAISATGEELGIRSFRLLRKEEFPDTRVKWGCEYKTWCVNPMVYLCFLLNRFVYRGGRTVKRELKDVEEVFALAALEKLTPQGKHTIDVVVNASGFGFSDPKVFPTRGQTCLVANKCSETVTRQNADGSWTFSVPRNFEGGTVIGGTKDVGDWNPFPDSHTRDNLLKAFASMYPNILEEGSDKWGQKGEYRVLADIVGRRPTRRGGMRLEKEVLSGTHNVVHAYGLGGRGYELSWGVAVEVKKLVEEMLWHKPSL